MARQSTITKQSPWFGFIIGILVLASVTLLAQPQQEGRTQSQKLFSDPRISDWPRERLYTQGRFMAASGKQIAARLNRDALEHLLQGRWQKAVKFLTLGKKKAPQFLPFRYNLGVAYFHLNRYDKALQEFRFARRLLPNWSKIYIRIGECRQKMAQKNEAIDAYRKAIKQNERDMEAMVALGNLYYKHKNYYTARQYYQHAHKIKPDYLDASTGIAKIKFAYGKYYQATQVFKKLDYDDHKGYDKALHYYYAESLYKIRNYKKAVEQYKILLKYPEAPFFTTHAPSLIRFKLNLAQKFAGSGIEIR